MIWGISTAAFTTFHSVIALVGIVTGVVVMVGLIAGKRLSEWTVVSLVTNVATSVTGYAFPFTGLLPSHVVGVLALIALSGAIAARYSYGIAGKWRTRHIVCSSIAVYLNCFVGVVQAFRQVPALRAAAPTQSEGPFIVAQLTLLAAFIVITVMALRRFHDAPPLATFAASAGR